MELTKAPELDKIISSLVDKLEFKHIDPKKIVCFRSTGAKARARARIWAFPRIWQMALDLSPHYVIEVISHHFDNLKPNDQLKVLIHELMHIPKNFSGALLPHRGRGRVSIDHGNVEKLFKLYVNHTSRR